MTNRWRENASVSNGTLKLLNKKEKRGGNDWTSGNIWTKEKFQYGYFECRYRYAAATGDLGSSEEWKLEAIQDGDTVYIRFPLLAKELPAGKAWVQGEVFKTDQILFCFDITHHKVECTRHSFFAVL